MLPEWITPKLLEKAAKASFENWGGIYAPHPHDQHDQHDRGAGIGAGVFGKAPGTSANRRRGMPQWHKQFKVDRQAWIADMAAGLEVIFEEMRQMAEEATADIEAEADIEAGINGTLGRMLGVELAALRAVRSKTWDDASAIMRSEVKRQELLADDELRNYEANKPRGVTYDACRRRIAEEYQLMFESFANGLMDPTARVREGREA